MAQCKQSPQEFIKNAFTPQVAVLCTPEAEKCCQKNNLNFIELLQPFSRLNNDVHYKDSNGVNINIRNLKVTFMDIAWRPPQAPSARKLLNSSVSGAPESRNELFEIGKHKIDVPMFTPWFEAWRDIFLRVQYPSEHEFTKHFVSCILVVSSLDKNPTETFIQLAQNLNNVHYSTPEKLPKWFGSNILKYFVVIHDKIEGNEVIATKTYESVKLSYGASNCFLLKINSRPQKTAAVEHLPDPWSQFIANQIDVGSDSKSLDSNPNALLEIGQEAQEIKNFLDYHPLSPLNDNLQGDFLNEDDSPKTAVRPKSHGSCMSTEDVEQVKSFIYEFTKGCLMPFLEKQIIVLNDTISNRKGMSKSLFSATKRWFSTSKPGASSNSVNNLIYAPDSPELQIRKLGDLYFMFGHYSAAFQAYHLAKRDYHADQAWLYYAGALEMASVAAFMANESNRKTSDYMEESISTYLNICKMPQFATRATILSCECLKSQNMYGEAAHQLIRMTGEESDLRSALFLEQASYCFLHSKMVRKYAFHMVLAGHRFSKAAQRKHSLKCYKQAFQIYDGTGWDLACDHIHYTIGRQANNLQHFDEAVESFSKLLKGGSKQPAQQQAMFLKEYLTILANKLKTESEVDQLTCPILPVPDLENSSLKVLVGPARPLSTPGKVPALGISFENATNFDLENKWLKLEEMLVQEAAHGSPPMVFKPMTSLYSVDKLNKCKVIAVVNEPIQISLELVNTLQTVLHLRDIYLLWSFQKNDKIVISNETSDNKAAEYVKTYVTKAVSIEGNSKHNLISLLTPLVTGNIFIDGFCYTLTGSNSTWETCFIKGKQKISIAGEQNYINDGASCLQVQVVPPAPCLQVSFSDMNLNFLSDELQSITVDFQNTSSVPLNNIYVATSVPHLVSVREHIPPNNCNFNDLSTTAVKEKLIRKNHITSVPITGNILEPGQTCSINIWVKAPNAKGPTSIDLLIYYENIDSLNIPRYRLIRHNWDLTVEESILVDVTSQQSHNAKTVEELDLPIKITNLNKVHSSSSTEITITNVGLLSKIWTLKEDAVTPDNITLHSQESAHIFLKTKRLVSADSKYSAVSLPVASYTEPVTKSLKSTCLAFAKKAEKPIPTIFDDFERLNLGEHKDGILLLQWQALVTDTNKKRIVNGQTQIPLEINRKAEDVIQMERILSDPIIDLNDKTSTDEEQAEVAQKQVTYNLLYSSIIKHNFQMQKLCIVPVKLLLHSITDNKELLVAVDTSRVSVKSSAIHKSNLFHTCASSNFTWLGNGKIIKTLKPLTTETVQLAAVLSGPGTFDLDSHIQVWCRSVQDEPYVLQSCQIQSAFIVTDVDDI